VNKYLESLGYLSFRSSDGSDAAHRRDLANFANLDWDKTTAFCPTPSSNGIVIRQRGEKNPNGVDPSEYEGFRDRLIRDLLAMTDPATGEKVITQVMKREDAFPGAAMEQAPDLTLVLCDHGFVSVRNLAPQVVTRPTPIGTHHPDGIFIMAGPGVRKARGPEMSIVDTTAVVAHAMGLDIPEEFEGTVPDGLYSVAWLDQHPVCVTGHAISGQSARTRTDDEDEISDNQREEMLVQLRLLGYLED